MTHPDQMKQAQKVIEQELAWLEDHELPDLPDDQRREWIANHLVMCLDTAGFAMSDLPASSTLREK